MSLLVNDHASLANAASLQGIVLLPGDVLYIPPCQVVVEKAVTATNIGVRATRLWVHPRAHSLWYYFRCLFSAKLSCIVIADEPGVSYLGGHVVCFMYLPNLRDMSLSRIMMEECTRLTSSNELPGLCGFSLADAVGRAGSSSHEEDSEEEPGRATGQKAEADAGPGNPKAVSLPDGSLTAVAAPDGDAIDVGLFAQMSEEDLRVLLVDISWAEFEKHILAATDHELFSAHEHYVRTELIGENNPDDIDAWVFASGAGDPMEDVICWYRWLSANKDKPLSADGVTAKETCL